MLYLLWPPLTIAHQAALSVGFLGQEYWSGLHFLLQQIFLIQGSNSCLLHWQADSYHWENIIIIVNICKNHVIIVIECLELIKHMQSHHSSLLSELHPCYRWESQAHEDWARDNNQGLPWKLRLSTTSLFWKFGLVLPLRHCLSWLWTASIFSLTFLVLLDRWALVFEGKAVMGLPWMLVLIQWTKDPSFLWWSLIPLRNQPLQLEHNCSCL